MRVLRLSLLCLVTTVASAASAQTGSAADEATGVEPAVTTSAPDHQPLPASARGGAFVLAIPESSNDNVVLLDATTGDLLTPAFLTASTGLSTPINAIPDTDGDGILICDQITDGVYRFSSAGVPEGIFAPSGGVNTDILNNVRGCAADGTTLYVTTAGPPNNAVAAFDAAGTYTGNFIAPGAGGLNSPFDVLLRTDDVLVPSINSDNILRFDRSGTFLDVFATGAPFTEQINESNTGTILAAEFTDNVINEYAATGGAPIASYTFTGLSGFRGVYELPSGALIVTTGGGIFEVLRSGTVVRTILSGVSARFVERIPSGFIVADEAPAPAVGAALRVAGANPFRLQTTLTLTVDQPQTVRVAAYDVTGRRVATLFEGALGAGTAHVLTLHGSGLAAGVYSVQAIGETFSITRAVTHVE